MTLYIIFGCKTKRFILIKLEIYKIYKRLDVKLLYMYKIYNINYDSSEDLGDYDLQKYYDSSEESYWIHLDPLN